MIVNPNNGGLDVFQGSRILKKDFNLIGHKIYDRDDDPWVIQGVYCPLTTRKPSGIRVKAKLFNAAVDIFSFVDQFYLEPLIDSAGCAEGRMCDWAGRRYIAKNDAAFHAFVTDEDDLADDLFDRELMIRAAHRRIPDGTSVCRYAQLEPGEIVEETWHLIHDGPDSPSVEGIEERWKRSERKRYRGPQLK